MIPLVREWLLRSASCALVTVVLLLIDASATFEDATGVFESLAFVFLVLLFVEWRRMRAAAEAAWDTPVELPSRTGRREMIYGGVLLAAFVIAMVMGAGSPFAVVMTWASALSLAYAAMAAVQQRGRRGRLVRRPWGSQPTLVPQR